MVIDEITFDDAGPSEGPALSFLEIDQAGIRRTEVRPICDGCPVALCNATILNRGGDPSTWAIVLGISVFGPYSQARSGLLEFRCRMPECLQSMPANTPGTSSPASYPRIRMEGVHLACQRLKEAVTEIKRSPE